MTVLGYLNIPWQEACSSASTTFSTIREMVEYWESYADRVSLPRLDRGTNGGRRVVRKRISDYE